MFFLVDLLPQQAKDFVPNCLPAFLIFMMIRFNDLTMNSEELKLVVDCALNGVAKVVAERKNNKNKEVKKY
jgi:hypothetical protein